MAAKCFSFLRTVACLAIIASMLFGCQTFQWSSPAVEDSMQPMTYSAKAIFDSIHSRNSLPAPDSQIDAAFDAAWSKFAAKYAGHSQFTLEQLETVAKDITPTIRVLAAMADAEGITRYSQIKKTARRGKSGKSNPAAGTKTVTVSEQRGVEIPPNAMAQWTIKGNCMDPDRPAPGSGDKFQLTPITELIDSRLVPVYQGFIKLTVHDREAQQYQQQIVWAFRTVDKKSSYASSLGTKQKAILNRSYPNGAGIFEQVRQSEKSKASAMQLLRNLLPSVTILGQRHNLADLLDPDKAPEIAETHLNRLIAMQPSDVIQNTGYEYSEIQNGIYAHIVGSSTLTTSISIVNTTPSAFYFQPALYAAEPQRKVQRVTLTTPASVQVTHFPPPETQGRLDDSFKKLEEFFAPRLDAALQSLQRDWACLERIATHTGYEVIRLALDIRGKGVLNYIGLGLDWITAATGYDPIQRRELTKQEQALAYSSAYLGLEAFIPEQHNTGPLQKINVINRIKKILHDIPTSAATSMIYCKMAMVDRSIPPSQKLSDAQVRKLADMAHPLD